MQTKSIPSKILAQTIDATHSWPNRLSFAAAQVTESWSEDVATKSLFVFLQDLPKRTL